MQEAFLSALTICKRWEPFTARQILMSSPKGWFVLKKIDVRTPDDCASNGIECNEHGLHRGLVWGDDFLYPDSLDH